MRHLFAPIVASLLYVVPSLASAAEPTRAQTSHVQSSHVVAAKPADVQVIRAKDSADDKAKYAARETKTDKAAQDYRGGDTIVIGASAAVAILAVVLLIVLL